MLLNIFSPRGLIAVAGARGFLYTLVSILFSAEISGPEGETCTTHKIITDKPIT